MADEQRSQIPTKEEIAKLPRWAQVAFAARCARRVQPIFKAGWSDAPKELIDAVEITITFAEDSAAAPTAAERAATHANNAALAASAASAAASKAAYASPTSFAITIAARSAQVAAHAADASTAAYNALSTDSAAIHAASTAHEASRAAMAYASAVASAMRVDFDYLLSLSERENWKDNTPVPTGVFGPIWPHAEPEGWPDIHESEPDSAPAISEQDQTLTLRIAVPSMPDTPQNREKIREHIRKLIVKASQLHIAEGGSGLKIKKIKTRVPAGIPEGSSL